MPSLPPPTLAAATPRPRRTPLWRRFYWRLHTGLYALRHGLRIGRGVYIRPGAHVRREGGGGIRIGDFCHIHPGAMLLSYGGDITLGPNCSVNPYAVLYGQGGLSIGDGVRIGAHSVIVPANHGIEDNGVPITDQPEVKIGIRIEDDVWLGAGARILDGSVIEAGAVVAAGAVVRGRLQSKGVYGGVPARLLRWRPSPAAEQASSSLSYPRGAP